MRRFSSVMVTGGTGSFGQAFVHRLLADGLADRVVVYSRDELKQAEMRGRFHADPRLRFFIGDVRDVDRLTVAMRNVEVVVHAAALKRVETAEYNPFECIKTNVLGSQNVISAAITTGAERVLALSTDKASSPVNLYGASKLCGDKLFVAGNHYASAGPTRFSVVRYGNVLGSRGSVVGLFRRMADEGRVRVTDREMTRFWITLDEAVDLVLDGLDLLTGGEILVPKIPSSRVVDLAEAVAPGVEVIEVGLRPGEKIHEEMFSEAGARRTLDYGDHFIIEPVMSEWGFKRREGGTPMQLRAYRSDTNTRRLSVQDLRDLLVGVPA